jgi:hypothetical protein
MAANVSLIWLNHGTTPAFIEFGEVPCLGYIFAHFYAMCLLGITIIRKNTEELRKSNKILDKHL